MWTKQEQEKIRDLQQSYSRKDEGNIIRQHLEVIKEGLNLIVESDRMFSESEALTSEWSNIGTKGASFLLKAVELADRFDRDSKIISKLDKIFLLNLAAVENYRCGRHGIAYAITRNKNSEVPTEYSESPTGMIVSLLREVSSGNFEKAWKFSEKLKEIIASQLLKKEEKEDSNEFAKTLLILSLASVCELVTLLHSHLISGEKIPDDKGRWLNNAIKFGKNTGDNEYQIFVESFVRAFHSLEKLSIWNIRETYLSKSESDQIFVSWATNRVNNSKPFLFPSQYEALISRKCLLHNQELVSMPTGGGKTLVSEVFVLLTLLRHPNEKCLYIVPTRALASEKRDELSRAFSWDKSQFSICQMTGDVAFDIKGALQDNNVIVLTPEKFDILMRNQFFNHLISGVVVDEFHTIRTTYRGIRLQLSIKRFIKNYPANILFISAIMRNSDLSSISSWMLSSDPFSTDWKPTPLRIGTVSLNERPRMTVSFNDGTYRSVEDLSGIKRVDDVSGASVKVVKAFLEGENDQVLHFNLTWRAYRKGENKLVDLAEKYMNEFKGAITFNPDKLQEFSRKFSRLVGPTDPLAKAFQKGIAVHWGELPHIARSIEEDAIRSKAIGLILSTSTLATGVNLPIRTIFIPKLSTRKKPLDKGLFFNIIGRAGRPNFHPEGQVVLAINEAGQEIDKTPRARAEEYAEAGNNDIEPITTSIIETANVIEQMKNIEGVWSKSELEPNPNWEEKVNEFQKDDFRRALAELEALSSSLLASVVEGLIQNTDFDSIRDIILLGTETHEQELSVRNLVLIAWNRLFHYGILVREEVIANVTEWGEIVYKTGFGPVTCQKLKDFIKDFIITQEGNKVDVRDIRKENSDSNIFTMNLLGAINLPIERFVFGDGEFGKDDIELLLMWISGQTIEEISIRSDRRNPSYIRTYMRLEGVLSNYASWVLDSLYIISSFLNGETIETNYIAKLARYVLYGHFDHYILKIMELDVNKTLLRDDIIILRDNLPNFKLLFRKEYSMQNLVNTLRKSKVKTRMEEMEVANAILKLKLE